MTFKLWYIEIERTSALYKVKNHKISSPLRNIRLPIFSYKITVRTYNL